MKWLILILNSNNSHLRSAYLRMYGNEPAPKIGFKPRNTLMMLLSRGIFTKVISLAHEGGFNVTLLPSPTTNSCTLEFILFGFHCSPSDPTVCHAKPVTTSSMSVFLPVFPCPVVLL
ncbi:hypothetical protein ATANTOWER_013135 [Ataeniobius toweri]|uniref:Uncharacterized protein n=1 Tax=Ataeniobius toweri TaxID=208326 RepID=A0ABU7BSK3_9TELE|nr:hypothetical protein [Ataeniobius toweri]